MTIKKISPKSSLIVPNLQSLKIGNIHLGTIQSLLLISIASVHYFDNRVGLLQYNWQFGLAAAALAMVFWAVFWQNTSKIKLWQILAIILATVLVFNYEISVHAQILDGIDGAIDDVGTAAGGSFATTVLDAVIELIRIAVFIAVAGAVIAAIIFGVAQNQWQAPVLVVGVIVAIGLFLEIMGEVVFG